MLRYLSPVSFCILLVVVTGCSQGPKLYPVTGTVNIDGSPVPEGNILFIPADKGQSPEGGTIKDGKFELKAKLGKNRVEISASKVKPGGPVGAMGEQVAEEYIPARFNVESTLSAEVTAGGPNKFDFPIESK